MNLPEMHLLDALADDAERTEWQADPDPVHRVAVLPAPTGDAATSAGTLRAGHGTETTPAQGRLGTCRISALRDGRYRVLWTSRGGAHGTYGPFGSLDRAATWCEGLERDCGWRWVR